MNVSSVVLFVTPAHPKFVHPRLHHLNPQPGFELFFKWFSKNTSMPTGTYTLAQGRLIKLVLLDILKASAIIRLTYIFSCQTVT